MQSSGLTLTIEIVRVFCVDYDKLIWTAKICKNRKEGVSTGHNDYASPKNFLKNFYRVVESGKVLKI